MDREAELWQRARSGHPRACELQTLAALEGAVNDILHELGPTFADLHVGPRLMPMAGSYPPADSRPARSVHQGPEWDVRARP
jgi:hypothetical protein